MLAIAKSGSRPGQTLSSVDKWKLALNRHAPQFRSKNTPNAERGRNEAVTLLSLGLKQSHVSVFTMNGLNRERDGDDGIIDYTVRHRWTCEPTTMSFRIDPGRCPSTAVILDGRGYNDEQWQDFLDQICTGARHGTILDVKIPWIPIPSEFTVAKEEQL